MGKIIYLHEFDYVSLNVDGQIFNINDCGPRIYKAFFVDVLVLVVVLLCYVFSSFFSVFVFVFVFSVRKQLAATEHNFLSTRNICLSFVELQFSF